MAASSRSWPAHGYDRLLCVDVRDIADSPIAMQPEVRKLKYLLESLVEAVWTTSGRFRGPRVSPDAIDVASIMLLLR